MAAYYPCCRNVPGPFPGRLGMDASPILLHAKLIVFYHFNRHLGYLNLAAPGSFAAADV